MSDVLRAGVIGVGMIGSLHARTYADDPRTELVGVVDIDAERAEQVAGDLGTRAYTDVETFLDDAGPDLVSVAVPEQHRHGPAVAAARRGVHLLLEKPLAPTLDEVDRLLADLDGADATIMVNFILRSDPRYLRAHETVASGSIGEPRSLTARRVGTAAGAELYGPWTDLLISTGIHDLDAMRWIVGAPVTRVHAEAVAGRSAQWGHHDAVLAVLRFANGAIGTLETSWVLPTSSPEPLSSALRVVATDGAITIDGNNHGVAVLDESGLHLPDLANWPMGRRGVEGSLRASIDHFVDCVRMGGRPVMGLEDAREAQAVVEAIKDSIASGQPVTLEPEDQRKDRR